MVTIKKYANRRLYDTERSAYINLDELAQMVRQGVQVQVVDAKSGEDLTRIVLVQLLLESPGTLDILPTGLLTRLIRSGGTTPLHPAILQQLGTALQMLDAQLAAFEQQFAWATPPATEPTAPSPPPGPSPSDEDLAAAAAAEAADPVVDRELAELRERLADLERRLDR